MANDDRSYTSVETAARGLLGDVVQSLANCGQDYVVVGGWSPVLLNSGIGPLRHPGTKDVDLLFESGASQSALAEVVSSLLREGYLPSAKHPFQLLKTLKVGSDRLVFNVDLLHPNEGRHETMLIKHIDLKIPLYERSDETASAKSIATPHASFTFYDDRYREHVEDFLLPSGERANLTVRVVDELGLIITKSVSVRSPKRPRDAFDIYLAVSQASDRGELVRDARRLKDEREDVFGVLRSLSDELRFPRAGERIGERIRQFVGPGAQKPGDYERVIDEFLTEIGAQDR